ncbi:MAG: alpha-ketoacid dehydrogenase subunit beta, partial [Bdellovibrionales bacterium]|nr:alpha-ketoacid dehydrogenase subunit beta [Bdellovibrionales bacterium]
MATVAQSIRMALAYAEQNLDLKDIFGEDVGPPLGGAFTVTQGLTKSWNSPLDERGIIGMATGLGLAGSRCVAE